MHGGIHRTHGLAWSIAALAAGGRHKVQLPTMYIAVYAQPLEIAVEHLLLGAYVGDVVFCAACYGACVATYTA